MVCASLHQRSRVVKIYPLMGDRFEVFVEGRHSEAFEGSLGAIAAAHALAAMLAHEQNAPVMIDSPWGAREVSVPWTIEEVDLNKPVELPTRA